MFIARLGPFMLAAFVIGALLRKSLHASEETPRRRIAEDMYREQP